MRILRNKLEQFFDSFFYQRLIVFLIVLNSALIGLETSDVVMEYFGTYIDAFDFFILSLFCVEIVLRLWVYRSSFFKSGWNIFDLLIVSISVLPAAGSFSVFRALRIVRTLRLLKNIPKLRIIIESLIKSLPSIGWIVILLSIVFYTFAVIGINLFGKAYPEYFGTLSMSFFTLFQIMTLESWSSAIARPIMDGVPFAAVYFICFILIATYTTLNIFIAIVVNTMNEVNFKEIHEEERHLKDLMVEQNRQLHEKIDHLQNTLNQNIAALEPKEKRKQLLESY